MSAHEWIKLHIHPDGPEISRLVELTGENRDKVFTCVLRWFFHVDRHCVDPVTGIGELAFNDIVGWRPQSVRKVSASRPLFGAGSLSLAHAMSTDHVQWLTFREDDTLEITGFEKHFSKSAKRRAQEALRKKKARAGKGAQNEKKASAKRPQNVRTAAPLELELDLSPYSPPTGDACARTMSDALASAFHGETVSKSDRRRCDRVGGELEAKSARPEHLEPVLSAWRRLYPDRAPSVLAIGRNWDQLTAEVAKHENQERVRESEAERWRKSNREADAAGAERRQALAMLQILVDDDRLADVEAAFARVVAREPDKYNEFATWRLFAVETCKELELV